MCGPNEPTAEDRKTIDEFRDFLEARARYGEDSRKIIAYGKLGRSWNLDPANFSTVGGDVDSYNALRLLAERNPDVDWLLLGRNSGENPQDVGLPSNVIQFWTEARRAELRERMKGRHSPMKPEEIDKLVSVFDDLTMDAWRNVDGVVVWAGQHGTSNSRLLMTGKEGAAGKYTNPQDAFVLYGSYIVRGITVWRNSDPINREEVWLCSDPRNYLKCRDLKWPLRYPIISQFNQTRPFKVERYGDVDRYGWEGDFTFMKETTAAEQFEKGHIWKTKSTYTYNALEMTALPDPSTYHWDPNAPRFPFGIIINENRKEVKNPRLQVMKEWVLPNFPGCEIWGSWSDASKEAMGRPDIRLVPHDQLHNALQRYRCTLTTPASGSGWATSKPWECFINGTVCFFHPEYDTQDHILGDNPDLRAWLRVKTPKELKQKVEYLTANPGVWLQLALAQRQHVQDRYDLMTPIRAIEKRLGLA
jgi:hypothetical protein